MFTSLTNKNSLNIVNTTLYSPRVRNRIHWIPRAKDLCCSGTHL